MQKPKHLIRGLFATMDTHQKVFVIHTIILLILLITLPIITRDILQSSTGTSDSIKFYSLVFWKSDFVVSAMIVSIMLMMFHAHVRKMVIAAFGVTDVFINFVCYMVIISAYIAIWDTTTAVHLNLTQTIWLAPWYYIIGIWLVFWLILHTSWTYKYGKQAHQATIINLATKKQQEHHNNQESFKNLFD